ncbi:MAG: hypothetical protein ABIH42_10320 [Planctomycetota bacterium]
MDSTEKFCNSCGKKVTPAEIEKGRAFGDEELTYCANCVSNVLKKVREIQDKTHTDPKAADKTNAAGVYLIPPTIEKKKLPRWILCVCAAEVIIVLILLYSVAFPYHIPYPTTVDENILAEQEIRTLIAELDISINKTGPSLELIQRYKEAIEKACSSAWAHELRRRMEKVSKEYDKASEEIITKVRTAFNNAIEKENYQLAGLEIDNFPAEFKNYEKCREQINLMRQIINILVEAKNECYSIIEKADAFVRKNCESEALRALDSFPDKYKETVYAEQINKKKKEITDYFAEIAAQQAAEEKRKKEEEEKKRREEEERKAKEEEQKRLAEENKRAEEERKKAEELKQKEEQAKQKPDKQTSPKPVDKKEPDDKKDESWTEIEMKHVTQKNFPFVTPVPELSRLESGPEATTTLRFLPLPNEGRKSGLGVNDRISKIEVDGDGDGNFESKLPADGGIVTVKLSYAEEEGESLYTVRIIRQGGSILYCRHSFTAGRFNNTNIFLIDEDNNGIFNDTGVDAIVVGNNTYACTLTEVIMINEQLYEVKASKTGRNLSLRPFTASKLGKLDLVSGFKAKGKLVYGLVFGVITDKDENQYTASFDLAHYPKGLDIPVGTYKLFSAGVGLGNKMSARIIASDDCKQIAVTESELTKINWGHPVKVNFSHNIDTNGNLSIRPETIRMYGAFGEEYRDWDVDDFSPMIQIRNERGKIILSGAFSKTNDGKDWNVFESLVPTNTKIFIRVYGKVKFLGEVSSEWK